MHKLRENVSRRESSEALNDAEDNVDENRRGRVGSRGCHCFLSWENVTDMLNERSKIEKANL